MVMSLASVSNAGCPLLVHKDPSDEREFQNVCQDIANVKTSTTTCSCSGSSAFSQVNVASQYSSTYYSATGSSNTLSGVAPGTSGQVLTTNGSSSAPSWTTPTVYAPVSGSSNYIQNSNTLQSGATFYVSSGTVAGQLTVGSCVLSGGGSCGGAGSAATIAFSAGVSRSSPTTDAIFPSSEFNGSVSADSMTITLNSSSVTLQGQSVLKGAGTNYQVAYYVSSLGLNSSSNFEFFGSSLNLNGSTFAMDANDNISIGASAGIDLTTGFNNVTIGSDAFDQATSGFHNTSVGFSSQNRLTTGNDNTSVGNGAGNDIITGTANTCIGADGTFNQPCQSLLYGSSNTMVGAGSGNINMTATDSGNTFIGFDAGPGDSGDAGMVYASCIGYKCIVSSSNTMVLGGTGAFSEYVQTSSMTVSSMTVGALSVSNISSGQLLQAGINGVVSGVTNSAGIVSPGTFTWTNTNGISVSTIAITTIANEEIPYANSSHVLLGSTGLEWDNSNSALNVGGGAEYTEGGINVENTVGGSFFLTADTSGSTDRMQFLNSGTQVGEFGVLGQGSPDNGPEFRFRTNTSDNMTLDDTGLMKLLGPGGGGLNVTYGVKAATGTFTTSVTAGTTAGSGTQLYRCSGGTDAGWILYGNSGAAQTLCTTGGGSLVAISYFAP